MKPKSKVTRRDLIKNAGLAGAAVATGGLIAPMPAAAQAPQVPARWDREADVVIIGAGATGIPAAIVARKAGSSVIVIDANSDIGGHAICSGANIPLGGGTSLQKKAGINDSPDLVFQDLTDWSVVQPNGAPDYRYNDKEIIRAFADNCAQTFEFLVENGVKFVKDVPDGRAGSAHGNSVPRQMHVAVLDWPQVQTGRQVDPLNRATASNGNGLMRPLEASARQVGVEFLLEHRMTDIYREQPRVGPRDRHRRRQQRTAPQHPRPQGGDRRDRRPHGECQFPPHVRSAPDRGILRAGRHAVVGSGRLGRARRHGDRRFAVGPEHPGE